MQSCTTEEVVLEREANKKNYITSEKVSIENVLSVLKNPAILSRTETFKTSTPEGITQKSGEKPNVYFTKIVKGNEYTTYLLLLNSYSTKNPYFMYYVITQDATTEKVGYLKYIPDTAIPFIDINTFSGKIQILDLKKNIRTESSFLNGQPKKQANTVTAKTAENCTIKVMYIAHYCTNGGDHSLGESCGGNLINDAYNEYTSISEICTSSGYDNSAPVPNELMNLSNGIGGGGANVDIALLEFEQYLDLNQQNWWNSSRNSDKKAEISNFLIAYPDEIEFAREMLLQMIDDPSLKLDVESSFKSPFNIDKSSIKDVTEEDKKFNSVYKSLTDSPAFKNLFLDLFDNNNKRFNVKFEIIENLDNITRKIDGFTTPPVLEGRPTLIQINKQILTSTGLRPMTNIEIAKTILHECIHAYLAIKGKYPDAGGSTIPGIENMTFAEVLKATRPGTGAQHDFMYKNMVPTMQKILAEIRDSVTSSTTRATVESIRLQPNFYSNPIKTTLWNWNDYFYYLSLNGLQDTEAFKISFPANTDQFELLLEYNFFGHKHLKN